jgi:WD40 repeat protein
MRRDGDTETMLDGRVWTELRQAVTRFRTAWRGGELPAIEAYLPADPTQRAVFLRELVHEEVERRLRAGEAVSVESYVDRFEELRADPLFVRGLHEAVAAWRSAARASGPGASDADDPPRIGRYELGEVVGRGAFGVVHRAYDTMLRRTVALKRPRPGAVETPEAVERFLREARAVAALRHPNIVAVHDAGQADGRVYLVGELIEGRNLADELAARRPGFGRSAGWVAAMAEALAHAHAMGLIHRDVKPSNVLIDRADRAHLTDFGLAKSDVDGPTLTAEGQVIGTPAYMAPEQADGRVGSIDARTDVYALGAVLYELLTGSQPFAGAGPMLLARIREEEPIPPRRRVAAIPRDLETICLKCLRKAPGDRYASAAALADDLRRFLAGQPIAARPVPAWERAAKWARRRPAMAALSAICAASAVGLIGAWLSALERERRHAGSMLRAARVHAGELRREAEATRRHLYDVELDRAYDAWNTAQGEVARRILDAQRPGPDQDDLRGFEWDYLWGLCDRALVLRGHRARVGDLAFSPDGALLATASNDRTIKLWNTADWSERATLTGHERAVVDLAFSHDGRALYTGGYDATLRRWELNGGRTGSILHRAPGAILALDPSPDGKALAFSTAIPDPRTHAQQLSFLDLATGAVDAHDIAPGGTAWTLAFAPDGATLAHPDPGGHQALIWDVPGRRIRARLKAHTRDVTRVRFSPDGRRLATAALEQSIRIWDAATGRELGCLSDLPGVPAPAFSPDGRVVAFTTGLELRFWDLETPSVRAVDSSHRGPVPAIGYSPDGAVLATGGSDGAIRIWDARTGKPMVAARAGAVASESDGDGPKIVRLDPSDGYACGLSISPDGRSLAAGTERGSILVLGLPSGAVRLRLAHAATSFIRAIAFTPDGRTLAAAGDDPTVRLYDAGDGRERLRLADPDPSTRSCWSLVPTPDARSLVAAKGILGAPGRAVIWDLDSGRIRDVLRGHSDYVRAVDVAPDGRTLASAGGDETIKVWDLASGRELATFQGHRGQVLCLDFDPSGTRLASGSEDRTVRIWDVAGRRETAKLDGHISSVPSVAFTPDGTRLASAGGDGRIHLWDVATGRRIGTLGGHHGRVNRVRFAPDGRTLVSASIDGTVRIWRGDPAGR